MQNDTEHGIMRHDIDRGFAMNLSDWNSFTFMQSNLTRPWITSEIQTEEDRDLLTLSRSFPCFSFFQYETQKWHFATTTLCTVIIWLFSYTLAYLAEQLLVLVNVNNVYHITDTLAAQSEPSMPVNLSRFLFFLSFFLLWHFSFSQ